MNGQKLTLQQVAILFMLAADGPLSVQQILESDPGLVRFLGLYNDRHLRDILRDLERDGWIGEDVQHRWQLSDDAPPRLLNHPVLNAIIRKREKLATTYGVSVGDGK